jgi:hypothetical protein
MESDAAFLDEDVFYPSNFEDDGENMVGVKEFLLGMHGDGNASSSTRIFDCSSLKPPDYDEIRKHEGQWMDWQYDEHERHEEQYENWQYDEHKGHGGDERNEGHEKHEGYEEYEGHEVHEGHEGHEGHEWHEGHEIMNDMQESSLPLFEQVIIDTFPKYMHFTQATMKLMIECVQRGYFPTYIQIQEADSNFVPLLSIHGRSTSTNIPFHTIERWKKIQVKVKVVETSEGMALSPITDAKGRIIPPIESWYSIVEHAHVDIGGKHVLLTPTINAIRTQWSTDIHVGGIHTSFIQNCLQFCQKCQGSKWWDQILTIPHEDLNTTLDALCLQHIVLRRRSKRIMFKRHIVTIYCCHRGGNKDRAHRKRFDVESMQDKNSRRERKSRLCNCCFQIKIVEPRTTHESKDELKDKTHVTIYVHTKHNGHQPGSDADSFFLPVHPYVISWATENLKYMYSTAAVAAASERDQELFRQSVGELEQRTHRFHIIKTEVQQLAYSLRVNGE